MIADLVNVPSIYCALSRSVLPQAVESAAFARREFWTWYVVIAVLAVTSVGREHHSALANVFWAAATALSLMGLLALAKRVPSVLRAWLRSTAIFSTPCSPPSTTFRDRFADCAGPRVNANDRTKPRPLRI